jgi:hypothetical protein
MAEVLPGLVSIPPLYVRVKSDRMDAYRLTFQAESKHIGIPY